MMIRKSTKETKRANMTIEWNELGKEYKGDEVDEKTRELRGISMSNTFKRRRGCNAVQGGLIR